MNIIKSNKILNKFFQPIDIIQLVLFRIVFGILLFWHCIDALFSGWVKTNFIKPTFTFSHIGMEWLQPLSGNGMYYYFAVMAVCGILISIGFFYKISLGIFTLLWSGSYFMQKTAYNNHYYLLMLLCLILLFLPANSNYSVDARINPSKKRNIMPAWCKYVLIFQVAIVYFYATVAKLYSGWLDGSFIKDLLLRNSIPELRTIYTQKWFYLSITYGGLLFDFLIIPLMLSRKTRKYAFVASLFFHLFNKAHLGIGIFPFLALSFSILFFPPEFFRKYIFRNKIEIPNSICNDQMQKNIVLYFFVPFFILQMALPLRHWLIKGDVLWTEEGHRLSWRMMLRHRSGYAKFLIVDNTTKAKEFYKLKKILTKKQIKVMRTKPDMIWQTCQKIKEEYQKKGMDISIYIDCKVSINGKPMLRLIDPKVDFAIADWNYFWHNDWILLY